MTKISNKYENENSIVMINLNDFKLSLWILIVWFPDRSRIVNDGGNKLSIEAESIALKLKSNTWK